MKKSDVEKRNRKRKTSWQVKILEKEQTRSGGVGSVGFIWSREKIDEMAQLSSLTS